MNEVGLSEGNVLFPVFLKLNQIQTVVVGGGNVGLEKVEALLKNDPKARIRIIATVILLALQELAVGSEGKCRFNVICRGCVGDS